MTNTHWNSRRDKYGRKVYELSSVGARVDAVVVVLPKAFAEQYPEHGRYLVNFWLLPLEFYADGRPVRREVYRSTLRSAMEVAESTVAELRAIPGDLARASREQLLVARQDAQRDVRVAEGALAMLARMEVSAEGSTAAEDLAHALNRLRDVDVVLGRVPVSV